MMLKQLLQPSLTIKKKIYDINNNNNNTFSLFSKNTCRNFQINVHVLKTLTHLSEQMQLKQIAILQQRIPSNDLILHNLILLLFVVTQNK